MEGSTQVTTRTRKARSTSTMAQVPASRTTIAASTVFGTIEPTKAQIRERAYFIYLNRRGIGGDPAADWAQAERELREEFNRGRTTVANA